MPIFEAIKITSAYSCHYDFNTLDENAILGRPPELENFYLAAGFSGHGFKFAPLMGSLIADRFEGKANEWESRFRWRAIGEGRAEAARKK